MQDPSRDTSTLASEVRGSDFRPTIPTVVISLDLELAWGSFDVAYGQELLEQARWTHDVGAPLLLSLLTKNNLSATWAAVGLVMEDRLPAIESFAEVSYPHFQKPWFSLVPKGAAEAQAPEWFGPSLIQSLLRAVPAQEIGFHSYSHVIFGDSGTPRERAVQELAACRSLAKRYGFQGTSFVFPRNSVAWLDELRSAGFFCFRLPDQLAGGSPGFLGPGIAAVVADFMALPPSLVAPVIRDGIVGIPGSLMVRYAGGWRRFIPDACRAARLRNGLKRVASQGGVFHVWLHPENLYAGRPRLERILAGFLEELGEMVADRRVRCLTMGELASEVILSRPAQRNGT